MNLQDAIWYDYHLYDLFHIDSGNKFDKSKMTTFDPTVNFVGRSSKNNGVTACVDFIDSISPYPAGDMTIALGGEYIGSCFIQRQPFYTSQNVAVLSEINPMSENVKLFIANLIRYESKNNYKAFARELNSHIKTDFIIELPSICQGIIDFDFIDQYIENLKSDVSTIPDYFLNEGYDKACWYLDNVNQLEFENTYAGIEHPREMNLKNKKWLSFKIGEIFRTYTGGDLIIGNINDGDIPVVSHSAENNGIKVYSAEIEGQKLFDHTKTISLADRGTFFAAVQYRDFYIGTRVKALEFLDGMHSAEVMLFFATIINYESFRFCYGRNCTNGIDNLKIKLPVDDNEKPDYQFMKNYIKSLPFSNKI